MINPYQNHTNIKVLKPVKKMNSQFILDPIHQPHKNDVLCGRDHTAHNHEGNAYFRRLIKSFKVDYISGTRQQKREYAQIIYDKIKQLNPPGRLLKYNPITSTWEDIGGKNSLLKIKQALREGAPNLRHSVHIQAMLKNKTQLEKIKSTKEEATNEEQTFDLKKKSSNRIIEVDATVVTSFRKISQAAESVNSSEMPRTDFSHDLLAKKENNKTIATETILENDNRVLNALPGPRIIPKRYF